MQRRAAAGCTRGAAAGFLLGSPRLQGAGGGSSRGWKERGGGRREAARMEGAGRLRRGVVGTAVGVRGMRARQNVRHTVVGRLHCIHN
jgi:hypothetical protein